MAQQKIKYTTQQKLKIATQQQQRMEISEEHCSCNFHSNKNIDTKF